MTLVMRQLYHSSNGDRWYLARDPDSGRVFVRHRANLASGGRVTDLEVGAFLSQGNAAPEQRELLRLIGTLVDETADSQKTGVAPPSRRRRTR